MKGNVLDIALSWRQLEHLQVFESGFTGTIPSRIGELSNLGFLHLDSVPFIGTLPEEVTTLTKLSSLSIGLPQITGTIPDSIGALSKLGQYTYIHFCPP